MGQSKKKNCKTSDSVDNDSYCARNNIVSIFWEFLCGNSESALK